MNKGYNASETLLFSVYPHDDNLNSVPLQQPRILQRWGPKAGGTLIHVVTRHVQARGSEGACWKLRVRPFLGVPTKRILVYISMFWGPFFLEALMLRWLLQLLRHGVLRTPQTHCTNGTLGH